MLKKFLILLSCCPVFLMSSAFNSVVVDDQVDPLTVVSGFDGPAAIALTSGFAYVCNYVTPSISVIDLSDNQITTTITNPAITSPYNIAITGTYAYIVNRNEATLNVIDTSSNTLVATLDVTAHRNLAAFGNYVFLVGFDSSTATGILQAVDVTTPSSPSIVGTITSSTIQGPGIAVRPDGDYVYVDGSNSDLLYYTADSSLTLTGDILTGSGLILGAITITSGDIAYVCTNDLFVEVFNVSDSPSYLQSIDMPDYAIAIASGTSDVYTCNFGAANDYILSCPNGFATIQTNLGGGNGSTVSVIDTGTNEVIDTISGFNSPQAIAVQDGTPDVLYVCDGSVPILACIPSGSSAGNIRKSLFNPNKGLFAPTTLSFNEGFLIPVNN